MIKTTSGFLLLAILLAVLFLNTHITLLGSGFLIGDGTHVLTYHGLVKEAKTLKIKFPNEDDIEAKTEEEARKLLVKEGGLSILADDTLVDTHDYEMAECIDES